jgi:inositol 1,4,5-triphosphate receptor type 3
VSVLGSFQFLFAVLGHAAYLIEYYPNIVYSEKMHMPVIEFSDYPLISHNDSLLMRHVNEHFNFIIPEGSGKCLSAFYILINIETLYFLLFIAVSAVALWNPFWYCILLLDVIKRSHAVKNILMSITLNWKQLIVTTIFGLFIIFIFATIGFAYFNEYYSEENAQFITYCSTLYECFFSTLNLGIRMGGGIGDALVSPKIGRWNYWPRVVFDIAFFVIVIIIILNVIFGIIIDTFAELRDKRQALESDMKNNCYICGTLRSTLELQGQGWAKHFLVEHSPLAYLAFIIYLREKEMIECNGLEKFVKEKLQTFDTSFFPTTSKYLQDHLEE